MVQSWEKYIQKHPLKKELYEIIRDIAIDNIDHYDIKRLGWFENYFRIRKGKIRIVFVRTPVGNMIKAVDTRGDIYKNL